MPNQTGLYIELFHGRDRPDQELDDWGEEGPIFGPYKFVHTTYAVHIKMGRPDGDDREELVIENEMVRYGGRWYGDWSVFAATPREIEESGRHEAFDEAKARLPGEAPEVSGVIRAAESVTSLLLDAGFEIESAALSAELTARIRDIIAEETAQPELLDAVRTALRHHEECCTGEETWKVLRAAAARVKKRKGK